MSQTLLIVEDHSDTREIVKFAVHQDGYQVLEAMDGYQAIEIAKVEQPDLILMDASLPLMDGITAIKELKQIAETREIPIICVTAHGHYYQEKALEAGCNEVMGKPVDFSLLKQTITRYLSVYILEFILRFSTNLTVNTFTALS